jgi:hypothetical protein
MKAAEASSPSPCRRHKNKGASPKIEKYPQNNLKINNRSIQAS